MSEVVSFGTLSVNIAGPGAALKDLQRVKSADIKDGRSTEVVMAYGVLRGAGFRRKQGGFEIDLEVYMEEGVPEVDWDLVNDSYTTFHLIHQLDNSPFRYDYTSKVSNVDKKVNAEGDLMQTVKLVCSKSDRS